MFPYLYEIMRSAKQTKAFEGVTALLFLYGLDAETVGVMEIWLVRNVRVRNCTGWQYFIPTYLPKYINE